MSFWLHEYRFVSLLKSIPSQQKIFFLVALFLSSMLFFVCLLYRPLMRQIHQKNKNFIAKEQQKLYLEQEIMKHSSLLLSYKILLEQWNSSKKIPQTVNQIVSLLFSIMYEQKITCNSLLLHSSDSSDYVYDVHVFSLIIQGYFHQILSLLHLFKEYGKSISFISFKISTSIDDQIVFESLLSVKNIKSEYFCYE